MAIEPELPSAPAAFPPLAVVEAPAAVDVCSALLAAPARPTSPVAVVGLGAQTGQFVRIHMQRKNSGSTVRLVLYSHGARSRRGGRDGGDANDISTQTRGFDVRLARVRGRTRITTNPALWKTQTKCREQRSNQLTLTFTRMTRNVMQLTSSEK